MSHTENNVKIGKSRKNLTKRCTSSPAIKENTARVVVARQNNIYCYGVRC